MKDIFSGPQTLSIVIEITERPGCSGATDPGIATKRWESEVVLSPGKRRAERRVVIERTARGLTLPGRWPWYPIGLADQINMLEVRISSPLRLERLSLLGSCP